EIHYSDVWAPRFGSTVAGPSSGCSQRVSLSRPAGSLACPPLQERTAMAVTEHMAQVDDRVQSFLSSPGRLLIDGEWVPAASGRTFETINPATEEKLAEVAHGDAEDIDRAVRAARKAFAYNSSWPPTT